MDWFRLYSEMKDDRKVLQFPPEIRWYYVVFLCVSSEETVRGTLPSVELLSIALRVRPAKVRSLIGMFKAAGLIDEDVTTKALTIHGWKERQFKSDDVNDRVKRFRNKNETLHETFHVTGKRNVSKSLSRGRVITETDAETESESDKEHTPNPSRNGHAAPRPRLGGEPSVCVNGEFVDSAPPVCTPEEVAQLEALAVKAFSPFGNGDVWVRTVRVYAASYPAEWIKQAIPLIQGKVIEDPNVPASYGVGIFQRWARRTPPGPPANLLPYDPSSIGVERPAAPARPMTDHQRKMAAYEKRSKELAEIIARQDLEEGAADVAVS